MPDSLLAASDLSHARGLTPAEVGRLLRISPDRVRAMIVRGELGAVDVAAVRCGRPRYVVLPHHLDEFCRLRAAAAPPKPRRRHQLVGMVDFYPDDVAPSPPPAARKGVAAR